MSEDVSTEIEASEEVVEENLSSLEDLNAATDKALAEPAAAEEAAPSYEPNYGFKVLDEEHEVEEWLRPLMKDTESEGKVRELCEKAFGLDFVKTERDKVREELSGVKGEFDTQSQNLQRLSGYVEKNDLTTFFHEIGITNDVLINHALTLAERKTMPVEQQQAYDNQWQSQRRAELMEQQYNGLQDKMLAQQNQQTVYEYNNEVSKPEVSQFQLAFDQRNGSGAFANEVARRGQLYEFQGNDTISVSQLVQEVVNFGGGFQAQQAQPAATGVPGPEQVVQAQQVPVIPNTGSSGGQSPAQKEIKTLEDLQKIANEL